MQRGLTILSALVGIALFASIVWAGCSSFLKNNDAYERGVAAALADPTVQQALGAPVTESWFINGTIESDAMTTRGAWVVRLRGANRSGTLRIAGLKRADLWGVAAMQLEVDEAQYAYIPQSGFREIKGAEAGPIDILSPPEP
jgi:hypothetical protein